MKVYSYKNCGTCRNALAFLKEYGIDADVLPIRETPPSAQDIIFMLGQYDGNKRKIVNTSGRDYREMGLKDRLEALSDTAFATLLSKNGNLVKRPFVMSGSRGWVGFSPDDWKQKLEL